MYQSSPSSSSSQRSAVPAGGGAGGLIRYGSAPGSLLNSAVDEVIGAAGRSFAAVGSSQPENFFGHFFSADSSSLKLDSSTCKVSSSDGQKAPEKDHLERSYGFSEISQDKSSDHGGDGSYSLARQRSSPADFFSYVSGDKNGFSMTQRTGDYTPQSGSNAGRGASRLKSQLSFTGHDSLAQISEVNEIAVDGIPSSGDHSFATAASFGGTDSWDDGSGSIGFTVTRPSKRAKDIDGGVFTCLNTLETQFSLPETSLNYMENFLQLPEDSVACKVRAKRGCATHPRSIAERERRTRISGKLKKLQELVPNMDKQTSYADMLDLAVQHIKGLQQQLQKLQKEQENCTCGCAERPKSCES